MCDQRVTSQTRPTEDTIYWYPLPLPFNFIGTAAVIESFTMVDNSSKRHGKSFKTFTFFPLWKTLAHTHTHTHTQSLSVSSLEEKSARVPEPASIFSVLRPEIYFFCLAMQANNNKASDFSGSPLHVSFCVWKCRQTSTLVSQIWNRTKPRALVQNQHTRELINARNT